MEVPSGPALIVCSLRSESTAVKIALGIGLPLRSATRWMRSSADLSLVWP